MRHPDLARFRRWAAVLIEFSLVQVAVQIVGAVTGVVVVRLLDTRDYGLYTIANGMLAAMVILADSGVGSATVGIAGRVWRDAARLGGVINTARRTMRSLRNAVGMPVALSFIWLLAKNGASPREIAVLTMLILAGGALSLDNTIDLVVARLMGAARLIQAVGFAAAALRLAATMALALVGLVVETAVLAVVLGWVVQYWATRRWLAGKVAFDAPTDPSVRAELKSVIATQFPNSLFYVLQGQISVWFLSIFGTVAGVADLGAVTRISVLFAVVLSAMQNVIIPRYARVQDPQRLGMLYFQICLGFAALVFVPTALVALAPEPVLWVLGPKYLHLSTELVLAVLGAAIGSISALAWSLNTNRAWFPPSWIWIPIDLISQVGFALLIGVATARQVLTIAIFVGLVQLAMNLIAGGVFIRRFRRRATLV